MTSRKYFTAGKYSLQLAFIDIEITDLPTVGESPAESMGSE